MSLTSPATVVLLASFGTVTPTGAPPSRTSWKCAVPASTPVAGARIVPVTEVSRPRSMAPAGRPSSDVIVEARSWRLSDGSFASWATNEVNELV